MDKLNMNKEIPKKQPNTILIIFFLLFFSAIFMSFKTILIDKNYSYLVESSCDQTKESCYLRDCTNPDDCPPNGLSVYKIFEVKGYDFEKCEDGTCLKECTENTIECLEIKCGTDREDACSVTPII